MEAENQSEEQLDEYAALRERIELLEERNRRVEAEKGWETSLIRRAAIAVLTYLVVLCYLIAVGQARPELTAAVPTGGYLLSTLALRRIRNRFVAARRRRDS